MKTTKETIKVGVVGCGYWGPNLIRNLRQSPGCELKMICDTSQSRLSHMQRLHPDVATTTRFEDLLNGADLDAVVIATPVRFHYEMARACLSAGKHVFIEKPMARTEAEAEELVAFAEHQGLVLMVGHTFLFSPAVRRMKEIIDSGDIGEVQYIAARRLNLGLFQKDINVAWDLAPHDISDRAAPAGRTAGQRLLPGKQPRDARHRGRDHDVSDFPQEPVRVHPQQLA